MKHYNNDPQIIDIRDAGFTDEDLKLFQEEMARALELGLPPFITVGESKFKISEITPSKEHGKKVQAVTITCTDKVGPAFSFFINKGDAFRLAFYREKDDGPITHFSTNMSASDFLVFMFMCKATSEKLFEALKPTTYRILNNRESKLSKQIMDYLDNKEAVGFIPEGAMKVIIPIHNLLLVDLITEYGVETGVSIDEMRKETDEIFKVFFAKVLRHEEFADVKGTEYEFQNPSDPRRMEFVAKHEIIPQLQKSGVLESLPPKPVIIDIGSGEGLNLVQIKKAIPGAITLGIEPDINGVVRASGRGIASYNGYVEETPELHGKADLVTIFNIKAGTEFEKFYTTLPKLLNKDGKLLIGIAITDGPRNNTDPKSVLDRLRESFELVEEVKTDEVCSQRMYLASKPRVLEKAPEQSPEVAKYQAHMQAFVSKTKMGLRDDDPNYQLNKSFLGDFLKQIRTRGLPGEGATKISGARLKVEDKEQSVG